MEGAVDLLLSTVSPQNLVDLLARHRVGPLWWYRVQQAGLARRVPAPLRDRLEGWQQQAVATELLQRHTWSRLGAALDDAEITHLVFKGRHFGELLYPQPWLRVGTDIDVLVSQADLHKAIDVLRQQGLKLQAGPPPVTHEVPLSDGRVSVDLHWELWRPGRSRSSLGAGMLAGRQRLGDLWVPDAVGTLLVLLLHTAITEYVSARLIRLIDVDAYLTVHGAELQTAWPRFLEICRDAGLRSAAWATLTATQHFLGTKVPAQWLRDLQPGPLRRAWLACWPTMEVGVLYERWPNLSRAFLSMSLQDDWSGVRRASSEFRDAVRRS